MQTTPSSTIKPGDIRVCANPLCSNEFTAWDKRNIYCGRAICRQGKRTQRAKDHELEFVGIDGEASNESDHRYILAGCGQDNLRRPNGIGWGDILPFLYDSFSNKPRAAYVGFFLGYDFAQWFKDLPENKARALFTTAGQARRIRTNSGGNHGRFPVDIYHPYAGQWEIDALDTRWVKFRPKGERSFMQVNNVGSFFQQSFEKVIAKNKWLDPIATDAEYATIKRGKAHRAECKGFNCTMYEPGHMITYMNLENEILARVMVRLNQGFSKEDVRLKTTQWYGPGQAAQGWLDSVGAPLSKTVQIWVPEWARRAARDSYFGGWFEIMMHGLIPGIMWEYDIHSAYPHIIRGLPCLEHGTWTQENGESHPEGTYTLIYAEVEGDDEYIGAMLHRDKTVNIRRPHKTGGWYWLSEVRAAQRAGLIHTVRVSKWVNYDACDCPPPLARMEHLFDRRAEYGNSSAAGKAYKLLMNSPYGKMVQSVGFPKYANPVYGSLITSGCRTMILDAIATHPEGSKAVGMVATDGVYFRSPHPGLKVTDKKNPVLGTWEMARHENMTLFKPGVYWDDENRKQIDIGDPVTFKARGVNARDFGKHLKEVDAQWATATELQFDNGFPVGLNWPSLDFTVEFEMTSLKQALARNKWETAGKVTNNTTTVTQSANPKSKRKGGHWDGDIIRTEPWTAGPMAGKKLIYSNPYAKPMGDDHLIELEHPDGPVEVIWNEIIGWETEEL